MPLYTVAITGSSAAVEVYGGLPRCDDYLNDSSSPGAEAFRALGDDDRKRRLVDATRYIDRKRWKGTRNADGGTTLAFPRDDLDDPDGTEATNAEQLALVEQAAFEMAAILAGDADAASQADQSSNIKSMGAGSARLEFFTPTTPGDGTATTLPTAVHELLGQWLAASGGVSTARTSVGGTAAGSCGDSMFASRVGYKRTEPF